ncbi:MAG: hypothetical protein M1133_03655, partial [Armatimonadetes bacterium]|nr:hypothetical protein [Armatimonadota bacterium]
GNVVLFVVNDALVDSKLVRFALPESWAGRTFSKYVKDDMRLGDRGDEITADHSDGRAIIEDRLMPMSLTVYVESGG